ncbi:hypothetical protein B0H17DRAFT_1145869 [Mycena rosella]|uniref:Uncharacterized protein n=1 Tax=Mycena rosella TaxID=1033263 RepID=A0AAD7G1X0_MYCRO|nr:hypothetical protein B0H17DRAFT_1145869 [Mycena rosella]
MTFRRTRRGPGRSTTGELCNRVRSEQIAPDGGRSKTLKVPPAMVKLLQWSNIALDMGGKVGVKRQGTYRAAVRICSRMQEEAAPREIHSGRIQSCAKENDAVACGFV